MNAQNILERVALQVAISKLKASNPLITKEQAEEAAKEFQRHLVSQMGSALEGFQELVDSIDTEDGKESWNLIMAILLKFFGEIAFKREVDYLVFFSPTVEQIAKVYSEKSNMQGDSAPTMSNSDFILGHMTSINPGILGLLVSVLGISISAHQNGDTIGQTIGSA